MGQEQVRLKRPAHAYLKSLGRMTEGCTSITAVLLLALHAGCGGTKAPSDLGVPVPTACVRETLPEGESQAYFPSGSGDKWVFRSHGTLFDSAADPHLYLRQVTGTKAFGDVSAAVFSVSEGSFVRSVDEVEVAASGLVEHGSNGFGWLFGPAGRYAAPFTAIPFPIQTCVPYEPVNVSDLKTTDDQDNDRLPETMAIHARAILSFEDVTVPVGSFPRALRVETAETFAMTYSRASSETQTTSQRTINWYAKGVGLVRHDVETDRETSSSELIAYAVGDVRHGVVPAGLVAENVDEASPSPTAPNRPAIGSDGQKALVVLPTSKGTYVITANLLAVVIDRNCKTISSAPLLDSGSEFASVSIAWNGQRYLVVYRNVGHNRLEMLAVSSDGQVLSGPILLKDEGGTPSIVGTNGGFLVSYTMSTRDYSLPSGYASSIWIATVDESARVTSDAQLYPGSRQWASSLAKDGDGGIMALFDIPPAASSPLTPERSNILAVARIAADGHAIDAAPIAVDAVPDVSHDAAELVFDGTNFVASWTVRTSATAVSAYLARISPGGVLLDGSPTTGAGLLVGTQNNPRIGRFGAGTIMVWGHMVENYYNGQGIGGARLTAGGALLDPKVGNDASRWWMSGDGTDWDALADVLWLDDRALVVWASPESQDVCSLGCAVAYPW